MTDNTGTNELAEGVEVGGPPLERELLAMINGQVSLDPTTTVERDTDLLLTGLVDSLGVVEIVDWLESRADVSIDVMDVVIENFQTVDQMLSLVDRLGRG